MADIPDPLRADQRVLLVAYCNGHRCAGLRRRRADPASSPGHPPQPTSALDPLHRAVRRRPHSLLLSTPCLGHCARAPMAAVGWAVVADGGAQWTGRPVGAGLLDQPGRIYALEQWIATTAPDLKSAPLF